MKKSKEGTPSDSRLSLWQSVAKLLLQRIRRGKYPVGQPLPREIDLADELDVSRNTVREALRALASDGVVLRKKRAGTIVLSKGGDRPVQFNVDPVQSLERIRQSTTMRVLRRPGSVLPSGVRRSLPEVQDGEWPHVVLVRHALGDGRPLSWTDIYLHPRLRHLEPLIDQESYSIFRLIERETQERVARIDTTITPCQLSREVAEQLGVSEGLLGLVISRRMLTPRNELIEVSETTLPADRYELEVSYTLAETRK